MAAECGYTNAMSVLPTLMSNEALFSKRELEALMGGTALALFRGGWRNASSADEFELDNATISPLL